MGVCLPIFLRVVKRFWSGNGSMVVICFGGCDRIVVVQYGISEDGKVRHLNSAHNGLLYQ